MGERRMAMIVSQARATPTDISEDCTADILESLHGRLGRLEDLMKVDYKVHDGMHPFELTLKPSLKSKEWSDDNTLFNSLRNNKGKAYTGDIWVNPFSGINKVTSVEIQSEMRVSSVSNGLPCVLVMCLAKVNNVDVILKLRQVEKETSDFTEREAKNAMKIALDIGVSKIFPELYIMFKITVGAFTKVRRTWECIGSQSLDELTSEDKGNPNWRIQRYCTSLLNQLHISGYVHGDPHFGNFMKERGVSRGAYGVPIIHLIDLDEVRPIPTEGFSIGYYLMILDYQAFMFWNNPRFRVFQEIYFDHGGRNNNMLAKVFNKAWLDNTDDEIEIAFGPYPFNIMRAMSVDKLRNSIMDQGVAVKKGKTYLTYLSSLDNEAIRIKFNAILDDSTAWKRIEDRLLAAWRVLDPEAMIKTMR